MKTSCMCTPLCPMYSYCVASLRQFCNNSGACSIFWPFFILLPYLITFPNCNSETGGNRTDSSIYTIQHRWGNLNAKISERCLHLTGCMCCLADSFPRSSLILDNRATYRVNFGWFIGNYPKFTPCRAIFITSDETSHDPTYTSPTFSSYWRLAWWLKDTDFRTARICVLSVLWNLLKPNEKVTRSP